MNELSIGGRVLALVRGDITRIPADAIVNAANERLVGGGGVDGAIHRAGGPVDHGRAPARYGPDRRCPTGSALVTGAGQLPARWVIHAVGPIWHGGGVGEAELLASAYRSSLRLGDELGARTIMLPAISTGVYGYPIEQAARVAVTTVRDHLAGETTLERATFVLLSADAIEAFERAMEDLDGRGPDS